MTLTGQVFAAVFGLCTAQRSAPSAEAVAALASFENRAQTVAYTHPPIVVPSDK